MEAVKKIALAVDEAEMIARIEADAEVVARYEEADGGQVMIITQRIGSDEVDVLLMFPTLKRTGVYKADVQIAPTAIKFSLNTFLNAARMLASHYGAFVDDKPEAMTHDNVPKIIAPS